MADVLVDSEDEDAPLAPCPPEVPSPADEASLPPAAAPEQETASVPDQPAAQQDAAVEMLESDDDADGDAPVTSVAPATAALSQEAPTLADAPVEMLESDDEGGVEGAPLAPGAPPAAPYEQLDQATAPADATVEMLESDGEDGAQEEPPAPGSPTEAPAQQSEQADADGVEMLESDDECGVEDAPPALSAPCQQDSPKAAQQHSAIEGAAAQTQMLDSGAAPSVPSALSVEPPAQTAPSAPEPASADVEMLGADENGDADDDAPLASAPTLQESESCAKTVEPPRHASLDAAVPENGAIVREAQLSGADGGPRRPDTLAGAAVEMLGSDDDEDAPLSAPPGLRREVIAEVDLGDSDDDEQDATLADLATAPDKESAHAGANAGGGDDSDEDFALSSLAPPVLPTKGEAEPGAAREPALGSTAAKKDAPAAVVPTAAAQAADASAAKAPLAKRNAAAAGAAMGLSEPPTKKANKSEQKEVKLTKDEMQVRVLEYMQQQNRPYNAQNVFDNLHGAVPKSQVQLFLDSLAASGRLVMKEYGKFRLYLVSQAEQASGADDGVVELEAEVGKLESLTKETRQHLDQQKKAAGALRARADAAAMAAAAMKELHEVQKELDSLRQKQASDAGQEVQLDAAELAKVEKEYKHSHLEWRNSC